MAVFATLVANTLIAQGPVFFLYFVESKVGQYDALFTPGVQYWWFGKFDYGWGDEPRSFNYTKIRDEFGDRFNVAPRGHRGAYARNMDSSWHREKVLVLIDTDRENQIGLGIDYPFEPMNAGECIVASRFKEYGFKLGD